MGIPRLTKYLHQAGVIQHVSLKSIGRLVESKVDPSAPPAIVIDGWGFVFYLLNSLKDDTRFGMTPHVFPHYVWSQYC